MMKLMKPKSGLTPILDNRFSEKIIKRQPKNSEYEFDYPLLIMKNNIVSGDNGMKALVDVLNMMQTILGLLSEKRGTVRNTQLFLMSQINVTLENALRHSVNDEIYNSCISIYNELLGEIQGNVDGSISINDENVNNIDTRREELKQRIVNMYEYTYNSSNSDNSFQLSTNRAFSNKNLYEKITKNNSIVENSINSHIVKLIKRNSSYARFFANDTLYTELLSKKIDEFSQINSYKEFFYHFISELNDAQKEYFFDFLFENNIISEKEYLKEKNIPALIDDFINMSSMTKLRETAEILRDYSNVQSSFAQVLNSNTQIANVNNEKEYFFNSVNEGEEFFENSDEHLIDEYINFSERNEIYTSEEITLLHKAENEFVDYVRNNEYINQFVQDFYLKFKKEINENINNNKLSENKKETGLFEELSNKTGLKVLFSDFVFEKFKQEKSVDLARIFIEQNQKEMDINESDDLSQRENNILHIQKILNQEDSINRYDVRDSLIKFDFESKVFDNQIIQNTRLYDEKMIYAFSENILEYIRNNESVKFASEFLELAKRLEDIYYENDFSYDKLVDKQRVALENYEIYFSANNLKDIENVYSIFCGETKQSQMDTFVDFINQINQNDIRSQMDILRIAFEENNYKEILYSVLEEYKNRYSTKQYGIICSDIADFMMMKSREIMYSLEQNEQDIKEVAEKYAKSLTYQTIRKFFDEEKYEEIVNKRVAENSVEIRSLTYNDFSSNVERISQKLNTLYKNILNNKRMFIDNNVNGENHIYLVEQLKSFFKKEENSAWIENMVSNHFYIEQTDDANRQFDKLINDIIVKNENVQNENINNNAVSYNIENDYKNFAENNIEEVYEEILTTIEEKNSKSFYDIFKEILISSESAQNKNIDYFINKNISVYKEKNESKKILDLFSILNFNKVEEESKYYSEIANYMEEESEKIIYTIRQNNQNIDEIVDEYADELVYQTMQKFFDISSNANNVKQELVEIYKNILSNKTEQLSEGGDIYESNEYIVEQVKNFFGKEENRAYVEELVINHFYENQSEKTKGEFDKLISYIMAQDNNFELNDFSLQAISEIETAGNEVNSYEMFKYLIKRNSFNDEFKLNNSFMEDRKVINQIYNDAMFSTVSTNVNKYFEKDYGMIFGLIINSLKYVDRDEYIFAPDVMGDIISRYLTTSENIQDIYEMSEDKYLQFADVKMILDNANEFFDEALYRDEINNILEKKQNISKEYILNLKNFKEFVKRSILEKSEIKEIYNKIQIREASKIYMSLISSNEDYKAKNINIVNYLSDYFNDTLKQYITENSIFNKEEENRISVLINEKNPIEHIWNSEIAIDDFRNKRLTQILERRYRETVENYNFFSRGIGLMIEKNNHDVFVNESYLNFDKYSNSTNELVFVKSEVDNWIKNGEFNFDSDFVEKYSRNFINKFNHIYVNEFSKKYPEYSNIQIKNDKTLSRVINYISEKISNATIRNNINNSDNSSNINNFNNINMLNVKNDISGDNNSYIDLKNLFNISEKNYEYIDMIVQNSPRNQHYLENINYIEKKDDNTYKAMMINNIVKKDPVFINTIFTNKVMSLVKNVNKLKGKIIYDETVNKYQLLSGFSTEENSLDVSVYYPTEYFEEKYEKDNIKYAMNQTAVSSENDQEINEKLDSVKRELSSVTKQIENINDSQSHMNEEYVTRSEVVQLENSITNKIQNDVYLAAKRKGVY